MIHILNQEIGDAIVLCVYCADGSLKRSCQFGPVNCNEYWPHADQTKGTCSQCVSKN